MKTKKVVLTLTMLTLLIISSKPIIPLSSLDFISMQIIIVYMLHPTLGKHHSFLTLFIYPLLGIFGLPVFASGGGTLYTSRPSFGYLLIFLILPFIQDEVEKLLGKRVVTFTNMFIQNLIRLLFIYLFGLTYKTAILLVFYGKLEIFRDILFFSSLADFLVDPGLTVIITLMTIRLRNYYLNNRLF